MYKQRLSASGQTIKEAEKHDIHQTKTKVAANDTAAANATTAGTPGCGSCYGAEDKEGDCCNTCEEVRRAGAGALARCVCVDAGRQACSSCLVPSIPWLSQEARCGVGQACR